MTRTLEVIVTSAEEAFNAQEGGADRLELAHSLEDEGLTPTSQIVHEVTRAVSIPVRVILRNSPTMEAGSEDEIQRLVTEAEAFADTNIDGFVLGFVQHGALDLDAMERILSAAPEVPVTFHRAFEHVRDPLETIRQLKQFPSVDRILTNGGEGSWEQRKLRLREWQEAAAPQIKIVVGGGLTSALLSEFAQETPFTEFHVGRAARTPPMPSGTVVRAQVASLKSALA
ncbi:MAG TPA: copper homeostasis protein CutC [Bryobacteraceae bacterium]